MSAEDLDVLKKEFAAEVIGAKEFRGEHTITVSLAALYYVLAYCKNSLGYNFLLDISSLDHFGDDPRFEMVYELATVDDKKHLRVKAPVGEEESVKSAVDLWLAADWHEREAYDMMGINFTGHPNMKRILMWEGYPFFPLRKDFPLTGYTEVRYDEDRKSVVYEPVKLAQDFRSFDFLSPWEGTDYVLPGDEKGEAK